MKKTLLLILSALLLVMCLVACGDTADTPSGDETPETTKKPTTSNKFEPEIIPADKIDARQAAVDYMYEMSSIEWTPAEDIDSASVQPTLFYKAGVKYTGMMYVTGSQTRTDADGFRAQLDENGVYTGPANPKEGFGNHCSSSISLSYARVSSKAKFNHTTKMMPNANAGMKALGNYLYDEKDATTDLIFAKNRDLDVFSEGYALLEKGDAILYCDGKTGHTRMIIENHVEKNAQDKIDIKKSYVVTIEQTSSFDETRTDRVVTTWYVEHKYTYAQLIETRYIPLTFEGFENYDNATGDNTFSVKSANTAKNITSGKLKGIVRSDYVEINSVTCEVFDKSGNVVVSQNLVNNGNDMTAFQFQNADADEGFTTLAAGEYVYTITANTGFGNVKVHELKFTVE